MAEYIEREALIEDCKRRIGEKWNSKTAPVSWYHAYAEFLDNVERAPTADVAPVAHGRWAHLGGDEWCCTNCGFVISTEGSWEKPARKHCEECGARMDGDSDAAD